MIIIVYLVSNTVFYDQLSIRSTQYQSIACLAIVYSPLASTYAQLNSEEPHIIRFSFPKM